MGQGTIPDDWLGEYCRYAVCWPNSEQWLAVLRGVLTLPARGRFWDEHTGSILEAQSVIRETFDQNLHLQEVIMSCGDTELIASFSEIAAAIRYAADRDFAKSDCCDDGTTTGGNAGYAGTGVQPIGGNTIPIYGTQPPAVLPPGETFPDGFTDEAEWQVHKCSVAHLIFDGVIYTLAFLSSLSITNVTALAGLIGAGIAGILVFPPAALAVMVGAVFAMLGFLGMFLSIREQMIAHKQEFICAMYDATSVQSAIEILADLMDLIIALVTTSGPLGAAIKTVLLLLFNGDALNQLFDSTADFAYPDANCEACIDCTDTEFLFNTDAEGFASVSGLPSCFGLTLNGSASLLWNSGVLEVTVLGGSPNDNGAFGRAGLDILVHDTSNLQVDLRTSGAGGLYIDCVVVFSDSTCVWRTLSNADPASGTFHGISVSIADQVGKHINELYFYLSSSTAGPDNTYLVEFDAIKVWCDESP